MPFLFINKQIFNYLKTERHGERDRERKRRRERESVCVFELKRQTVRETFISALFVDKQTDLLFY